jgi:hypothetical protein
MTLEARITPIWRKQKLFVALFFIAFGGYFFWDGAIGYPRKNVRYAEWKRFRDEGRSNDWVTFAQQKGWKADEWTKYANEHGWKEPYPDVALGPNKITEQYVFGAIWSVIGLGILGYWAQQIGRVLRIDDTAVTSPAGTRVPFEAITGLGLKKWDSKGLATVKYQVDGKNGSFVVDDYKFDTEPSRQILDEIKRQLETRAAAGQQQPAT